VTKLLEEAIEALTECSEDVQDGVARSLLMRLAEDADHDRYEQ
jgi:hypothetical protein